MKESFFKILGITAGAAFAVLITWVAVGAVIQTSAERHALETELAACQPYLPGTGNMQGEVNVPYFTDRSDAFAIAANQYGYAVFQDPSAAMAELKASYGKGIHLIQRHIFPPVPLTRYTYPLYENIGRQLTDGYGEALEQAQFVDGFLDIYENSFEPHGG